MQDQLFLPPVLGFGSYQDAETDRSGPSLLLLAANIVIPAFVAAASKANGIATLSRSLLVPVELQAVAATTLYITLLGPLAIRWLVLRGDRTRLGSFLSFASFRPSVKTKKADRGTDK